MLACDALGLSTALCGMMARRSASANPAVGKCGLRQVATTEGGGCCNIAPEVRDYYLYTYDAWCSGACPEDEYCQEVGHVLRIVCKYEDCSGTCPDDCTVVESNTQTEMKPDVCECGAEA
jgi:hypothetical protein